MARHGGRTLAPSSSDGGKSGATQPLRQAATSNSTVQRSPFSPFRCPRRTSPWWVTGWPRPILHGLYRMQTHEDVQVVRSAQIFDVLILARREGGRTITPRLRPLAPPPPGLRREKNETPRLPSSLPPG